MIRLPLTLATLAVLGTASTGFAASHEGNPAVKARQSHMQLYAFNIGVLAGMAKGEIDYDADTAAGAAGNLASLASMNQSRYWVPGTSNADLGDQTRALPAIWESDSNIREVIGQLVEATGQLAEVAGDGREAMAGALGGVGKACGTCHENFRQSD